MKLLNNKDRQDFEGLFSKKNLVGQGEISTPCISPSKLWCERYSFFKLTSAPMDGEEQSFESRGYAETGNIRHCAIQKFLIDNPEVEWVDVEQYVRDHQLPFIVKLPHEVTELIEKHPDISIPEAQEILKQYEVKLIHNTQPVHFKLDGLIRYRGNYYIVEIKTIGKQDFKRELIPMLKHQPQGKAYSFFLKIPRVCWIYECRDNFKTYVAFQEFEDMELDDMRWKLNGIIIRTRDNTPQLLETNRSRCEHCRYKTACDKLEESLPRDDDDCIF